MNKKAFFLVILAGLMWGSSGIFVKVLSPFGVSSGVLTLFRGAAGLVALTVYILIRDRSLFRVKPRQLLLYVGLGLTMFGASALYYAAIQMTTIATAAVLMYTSPVMVMIFSVLFLGEHLDPLKVASVAAMLVGCALVSGIVGGLDFHLVGILLALSAGLSYAIYTVFAKVAMDRGYRPLTTSYYSFVFMVACAVPFAEPLELPAQLSVMPVWAILLLCTMGLITAMFPYFLYNMAMKTLPAGTASALGTVEPMAGTVYGMLFFHEAPTLLSAIGILLILGSVVALGVAEEFHHKKKTNQGECYEKTEELSGNS